MVIDSYRSEPLLHSYSILERIEHDLSPINTVQVRRIPKSTKVIVIRTSDLTKAAHQLKGVVHGMDWKTIKGHNADRREYAYRNRRGEIRFKLYGMRKERIFPQEH